MSPINRLQLGVEIKRTPCLQVESLPIASILDEERPTELRAQRAAAQLSVLPLNVHFNAATRTQSAHFALGPGAGQRGKQLNDWLALVGAAVRLQQHLGDPRGPAEIAVDLKRRMGV